MYYCFFYNCERQKGISILYSLLSKIVGTKHPFIFYFVLYEHQRVVCSQIYYTYFIIVSHKGNTFTLLWRIAVLHYIIAIGANRHLLILPNYFIIIICTCIGTCYYILCSLSARYTIFYFNTGLAKSALHKLWVIFIIIYLIIIIIHIQLLGQKGYRYFIITILLCKKGRT